jgi:hypothetical protein
MTEAQEEWWTAVLREASKKMTDHIAQFVTPVSRLLSHDFGELGGTGSYAEFDSNRYVITNEHVAADMMKWPLTHAFCGSEEIFKITNEFVCATYPMDVAFAPISEPVWRHSPHSAATVPSSRFAKSHAPVDGELLFIMGYSQERAKFVMEHLVARATPYLCQEIAVPDGWDNSCHFALEYKPDLAQTVDGGSQGLPKPSGLSGSLVWNTRRIERMRADVPWKPDHAQVTGIIWGWPSQEGCLLATRVECFLPFLFKQPATGSCSDKPEHVYTIRTP